MSREQSDTANCWHCPCKGRPRTRAIATSDWLAAYCEPDGTIRLYFTVEEAKEKLRRSRQVATRAFQELERCGLIARTKQGLGRPAKITLHIPAAKKGGNRDAR